MLQISLHQDYHEKHSLQVSCPLKAKAQWYQNLFSIQDQGLVQWRGEDPNRFRICLRQSIHWSVWNLIWLHHGLNLSATSPRTSLLLLRFLQRQRTKTTLLSSEYRALEVLVLHATHLNRWTSIIIYLFSSVTYGSCSVSSVSFWLQINSLH